MTCVPGQSSRASSCAQDPVCGTLTTVVRSRVDFLCIWLALVASVSKGIRRVWARFPSAHAEVMETNGFTALWEGLVTDRTGPERERASQYQSVALFTKGWYYSAGISMTNCFPACMQIVDSTDKSVRQRYPATYFVYDLHLSGCQREFDGGQLKKTQWRPGMLCAADAITLRPVIICGVGNQAIATTTE
jgi:hypothetical protein